MSQLNTDLLIIGAGITGLTAAKFYAEKYPSRQVLIIEKYHKVGGFCRTNRVGEFIWDRAGHFFHFKTDLVKDLFSKSLKSIDFIHKSKNTITYDCNSIKIPFPHQKNWNCYTPDIQKKIIQDWSSSINIKPSNFENLVKSRYGENLSEKFLIPYNKKLYAVDLSSLSADCMGRFLPSYSRDTFLSDLGDGNADSYNGTFMYPKNGSDVFIEAIISQLPSNVSIMLNTPLDCVDLFNKNVVAKSYNIKYNTLINTISLRQFLSLSSEPECNKLLRSNKVLVLNIGFNCKRVHSYDWIYFADKSPFYRIGSYSSILKKTKESIYVEFGLKDDQVISKENIIDYLKKSVIRLKELDLLDTSAEVVAWEYEILNPGYCYITNSSEQFVQKTASKLSSFSVHLAGRYARWSYCSIEDNMLEAINLVNAL